MKSNLDEVLSKIIADVEKAANIAMKETVRDTVSDIRDDLDGRVLNQKTGRLRRSVKGNADVSNGFVKASISTNRPYDAYWEYGYSGTVQVKQHVRKIDKAFGKSIILQKVSVSAHSRLVNLKPRPYVEPNTKDFLKKFEVNLKKRIFK